MLKLRIGAVLVSLVALVTAVSPYLADWNETHLFNPRWSPHAKFHDAQTMMFGALLGVAALYYLWVRRKGGERANFNTAILLAGLYWLTQAGAFLFPNVAAFDPEFAAITPSTFLGVTPRQIGLDILVWFVLIIAYVFERLRLQRGGGAEGNDVPAAKAATRLQTVEAEI